MKDPKALFPVIFATSWLGNLILTILAFYLAFSHAGPLTPLIFLTVALCILSGNALPIGTYWILVRMRETDLAADSVEVSLRVREALERSEEVLGRLDEAEGSLAKGILLARQVPEQIKTSFQLLEELSSKLDTLEAGSFTETVSGQSASIKHVESGIEAVGEAVKSLKSGIDKVGKDIKGVPASMSELLEKVSSSQTGGAAEEMDVSTGERLDLLFESLESVQESLESLLLRVVELKIQATPPPFPMDAPEEPEEELEDELEEPEEEPEPEIEEEPEIEPEPEADAFEDFEGEPEAEAEMEDEATVEFLPEDEEPEPEVEMEAPQGELELDMFNDGKTRLVVHSMVGMSNKLFIRGDEPWLSWEDGQSMELIGIGEFSWAIDDLKDSIEVTVLLNDELVAEGGSITLHPGKSTRVNLNFPHA